MMHGKDRNAYRILARSPEEEGNLGKSRRRCEFPHLGIA
jgi:hypothetical protein